MKLKLIFISLCSFLLLTAYNATAQNNALPENKKEAKLANDNKSLTTPAKPVATYDIKLQPMPNMAPLQKTEPAKPAEIKVSTQDNIQEMKVIELNANTKKGIEPKNIDRPMTSTLNTTKAEPVAIPAPKVVKPDNK